MRIGVLDVGSNSAHVQIVEAYAGAAPHAVYRLKSPTRLAEEIDADGALTESGIRRLMRAMQSAAEVVRNQRLDELIVLATATLRQASNADEIRERVRRATGIDLTAMSGEDEARLTFLAVHRWFGWSAAPLMVVDVGGGSTEVAYGRDESPEWTVSVPVGAGRLTRELLPHHPARPDDVKAARRYVRSLLDPLADRPRGPARHIVGTSKTFKQLVRLAGAPAWRHGPQVRRRLLRRDVRAQIPRLARLDPGQRARLPGVAASRSRQILAGAIIVESAMRALEVESIDVVGWAVREGILLRRLALVPDQRQIERAQILG